MEDSELGQNNLWTAFYWKDYLADTRGLRPVEHGIYMLLMANYYATGKPLPDDLERLAISCSIRTPSEKQHLKEVLHNFFTHDGTTYRHKRIDEELAKRLEISKKRSDAVSTRYTNEPTNVDSNVEQKHTHTHTHTQKNNTLNFGAEKRAVADPVKPVVLPAWLPLESWNAFLEMRQRIRRPLTRYAQALVIKKLDKLRTQGQDVSAVLDQSVESGWLGVFEVGSGFRQPKKQVPTFDALKAFREQK